MRLTDKLLWLKLTHGLTIYLTDLDYPHHVTPEQLAALLDGLAGCNGERALADMYTTWRANHTPAHLRSKQPDALSERPAARKARRVGGSSPPRRAARRRAARKT